jgi:hypothetical protein
VATFFTQRDPFRSFLLFTAGADLLNSALTISPSDSKALHNSALAALHQARLIYRRVETQNGEDSVGENRGVSIDSLLFRLSDRNASLPFTLQESGTLRLPVDVIQRFGGRHLNRQQEIELRHEFETANVNDADEYFNDFIGKKFLHLLVLLLQIFFYLFTIF